MTIESVLDAEDFTVLACFFMSVGRLEKAVELCRAALRIDPNRADTLSTMGGLLSGMKQYKEAGEALDRALYLQHDVRGGWFNRGMLLQSTDKYDEACACFDIALKQHPDLAEVTWIARGTLEQYTGNWQEQQDCYKRALIANPASAKARVSLGMNQMLLGDWEEGLFNYESRLQYQFPGWPLDQSVTHVINNFRDVGPALGGLDGKSASRVLVVAEQGAGDVIQFARYGEILHDAFPNCTFSLFCSNELAPLLRKFPGWQNVHCMDDVSCDDFDSQIGLMSVPLLLQGKLRLGNNIVIPSPRVPWVKMSDHAVFGFLGERIGFCWSGNHAHPNDRFRSAPYSDIQRMIDGLVNFKPYCLKKDSVEMTPVPMGNWLETAASIQRLHRVVTVDTAIAHLAGAFGIPTYLMLPANPDWRWGLEGRTTPWYPSVEIFRQQKLGDWTTVVEEIRERLAS